MPKDSWITSALTLKGTSQLDQAALLPTSNLLSRERRNFFQAASRHQALPHIVIGGMDFWIMGDFSGPEDGSGVAHRETQESSTNGEGS